MRVAYKLFLGVSLQKIKLSYTHYSISFVLFEFHGGSICIVVNNLNSVCKEAYVFSAFVLGII